MSPLVKKDRRTRWVTDLRQLNKQTGKDSYPLTNIQEILNSLQGATVFSSLDACEAYHAVRIEPGSQLFTAFISPFGTFQYIRIPFGLAKGGIQVFLDFGVGDLFILTPDWSTENIAGVLSQVGSVTSFSGINLVRKENC